MESRSSKAMKIIFYLSFLPAAAVLIYAVIGLFAEVPVLFGSESGFDAFCGIIIVYGAVLCYIPVLPICLVYQAAYVLRKKIPRFEKIKPSVFLAVTAAAAFVIIIIAAFPYAKNRADEFAEKNSAQKMYSTCDEKIDYNLKSVHLDGVIGIKEQRYSCIMVKYAENKIGIINSGDLPRYYEISLKDQAENVSEVNRIRSAYYVQAVIPLERGRIVTFCSDEANAHRTIAMLLEYNDGRVYYASDIFESDTGYELFTGLNWSEYRVDGEKKLPE